MKKIISVVLALVIMTAAFCFNSSFAFATDGVTYSVDDGMTEMKAIVTGDSYISKSTIEKIVIPASVEKINPACFSDCCNLNEFIVDGNNKSYKAIDGVLFSKDGKELVSYPKAKKGSSYIVPKSVNSIGPFAFSWSRTVKKVTLGDNVKSIKRAAFLESSVECIYGGAKLEKIEYWAFRCSKIQRVFLPKSVKNIGVKSNDPSLPTIVGYKGSYAQKFAEKWNTAFVVANLKAPNRSTYKTSARKGEFVVKYKSENGAATRVQVKLTKGKKSITKTYNCENINSILVNDIPSGKYNVKIRACANYHGNKVYSPWTTEKSITVK